MTYSYNNKITLIINVQLKRNSSGIDKSDKKTTHINAEKLPINHFKHKVGGKQMEGKAYRLMCHKGNIRERTIAKS